jgi:hypothetical protein
VEWRALAPAVGLAVAQVVGPAQEQALVPVAAVVQARAAGLARVVRSGRAPAAWRPMAWGQGD